MTKTSPSSINTKIKPTISRQNQNIKSGHQKNEIQYRPEGSLQPFSWGQPMVVIISISHGTNKTARGNKAQTQKLLEMYTSCLSLHKVILKNYMCYSRILSNLHTQRVTVKRTTLSPTFKCHKHIQF